MLSAALIVAVVGWLLAAAMWCWACAEQDRADTAERSWLRELVLRVNAERARDNARGVCDDDQEQAAWAALREADRDIRALTADQEQTELAWLDESTWGQG